MADTPSPLVSTSYMRLGVLSITWSVYAVLLWVLFVTGPVVFPISIFVSGILFLLLFTSGLLASKRWDYVWQWTFSPTVGIPSWLWIGGTTTAIGVTVLSQVWSFHIEGALWMAVFCIGGSYAAVAVTQRTWLQGDFPWPCWVALAVLAAIVVIGAVFVGKVWTPLTAVFAVALVLFTFHLLFILPLTLYQSVRETEYQMSPPYPSVSVLIPAYNEEGYVGDCIESVLASTYPPERLEIIVIDDGSTDGTYAEAAEYRDEGVKIFHRDNGGKPAALNFGLTCSSGSVVVTIDADSRPEPTAIKRMVAQLQTDSAVGALSAPVLAENDNSLMTSLQRIEYALSNTNRRAYSIFGAVPVVPGCLGVYRREALKDVWGYDPDTITEDFDLTVKLLKNGWTVRHGTGIVWTVVPDEWGSLWRQRLRWYQGSIETIRKHWDVLMTPQYRYLHALSLPARLVSHLFTPIGSFVILAAVVWGILTDPSLYLLTLCVLFFLLSILIALFSLLLEDEPLDTIVYAPLLFIGYKHFVDLTVGVGGLRAFVAERRW